MSRPGRPRLDPVSATTQVTIRLSVKRLDDLCREATQARVTMSELIRRKLRHPPGITQSKN